MYENPMILFARELNKMCRNFQFGHLGKISDGEMSVGKMSRQNSANRVGESTKDLHRQYIIQECSVKVFVSS